MKDFNKIYAENKNMILHFLSTRTSREVAEELSNDVFMKVYKNLDKYDESKSKVSTWVMNIAKNTLIDHYRKVKLNSVAMTDLADADGKEFFEPSIGGTPLTDMMKNEYYIALKDVILELPKTYRRMANLYFNCNMSYVEIANRMKVPEGTVKGTLSRARGLMKPKLETLVA